MKLATTSRLKSGTATATTSAATTSSTFMSVSLTVSTEPNSTASRMCVFTRADTNSKSEAPTASDIDRNTPISVSDESRVRPFV